jgi:hypothetical protein
MFNPRVVAVQGVGFPPLFVGLQGLADYPKITGVLKPEAISVQGIGFTPLHVSLHGFVTADSAVIATRRPRSVRFERFREDQSVSLATLQAEDTLVTDFVVALVTQGFLDGN